MTVYNMLFDDVVGVRRHQLAGGREVLGQLDVGGQDGRGGRRAAGGVSRRHARHGRARRRRGRRQGLALHVRARRRTERSHCILH